MQRLLEIETLIAEAHTKKEYRPVAVGLIANQSGGILLVQSTQNPDDWSFVQGGIDVEEMFTHALLREIQEEVGIPPQELAIMNFLEYQDLDAPRGREDKRGFTKGKRYFFFSLLYFGSGVLECTLAEIADYVWVTPSELLGKIMTTREEKRRIIENALALYLKTR